MQGQCHCGAVAFEVEHAPESVTECNCSICRRYAARWAYYIGRQVDFKMQYPSGAAGLLYYRWNDQSIEFCYCGVCGCLTHYQSVDRTPESRVAVNTRMVEPDELLTTPVRLFDGADTWAYISE